MRGPRAPRAAKRLTAFSSCQRLVGYATRPVLPAPVRRDLPPFSPEQGAPVPLPVSAEGDAGVGEDTSQTNVQEAGVDEPDTVKTDGKTIFALANGTHLLRRGQVGGLGLGERIHAVRFIGDVGYVVTFRQTDPLYTLDLSDPDNPRVVGELKIPGYSAYLHPVGEELLLGVGQKATSDGRVQGLQLSLFDVSDLAHPTRLQKAQIGVRWSSSAVEWDHHAFLWWPATRLAVLPIDSEDFTGAAGYRVDRARGISELGRVSHDNLGGRWTPSISRAVVVGPRLFTVSDLGIKASGLESFAGAGWTAFPRPPEQPYRSTSGRSPRPRPTGRW